MKLKNLFFVDLQSQSPDKPFDGMAHGKFTDMWGSQVVIDQAELSIYVSNTLANLEATRTESGDLVGLPIDASGHDKGDGAGWIRDVYLSTDGNTVQMLPAWTDIGRELIQKNIRRFFSPTLDTEQQVILGGSLTNWPATRTKQGKILLKPIEMSTSLQTLDEEPGYSLVSSIRELAENIKSLFTGRKHEQPEIEPEPIKELITMTEPEFNLEAALCRPELIQRIEERAQARAVELAEVEKQRQHLVEFTASIVGKLGVTAEDMTAFLSDLPREKAEQAEKILSAVAEKSKIDFSEAGHSRVEQGTQPLPDAIKPMLINWLQAGKQMGEFFKINSVELGVQGDYNLREFDAYVKEK